jgi:hypothetical protein
MDVAAAVLGYRGRSGFDVGSEAAQGMPRRGRPRKYSR